MLYFLYGPDTYRSRQKLNGIIEQYKKIHQSGLNLKYLDAGNLQFNDFNNTLQQTSMFSEKKLMVLLNAFSAPDFKKEFSENLQRFIDSEDIIIFYEENTPKNNKFFDFLKKKAKSQEFNALEGENLKKWIKKELANYEVPITPEAINLLVNFIGSDLWQLNNEIRKLVNFKQKKTIEVKDVQLLVKPLIESDIFETIDAIAQKNKKRALSLIHHHLEKGDEPLYLLSMINFQFRNLLIIKDLLEQNRPYYTILKTAGLHPFVVRKSYELAQKFSLSELKKIYQKIFEIDLAIKTGKIEPEIALDLLITEI